MHFRRSVGCMLKEYGVQMEMWGASLLEGPQTLIHADVPQLDCLVH